MCKKIFCIFLSAITMLCFGTIANAQSNVESNSDFDIQPYYGYTNNQSTDLIISGGQAICESSLTGYSGTTTKVTITMYLEKKTLWWWSTEASWSDTFYSYYGTLSKAFAVKGGTYRVRTVYVVYCGNENETVTGYSSEVKY